VREALVQSLQLEVLSTRELANSTCVRNTGLPRKLRKFVMKSTRLIEAEIRSISDYGMARHGLQRRLCWPRGASTYYCRLGRAVRRKKMLYGTTSTGGAYNRGTVFGVTSSGQETLLHSFRAGGGEDPQAGLISVDGTLYGTTFGDTRFGHQGYGGVFSIKP
jgi:uncharacterized repeat protein (TIGR03803 family)